MKQGKILLTFQDAFYQKPPYKRIEAYIHSHKILPSTKCILIKMIYIPDPDSVHTCSAEAGKTYVCTKLKVIHSQDNNRLQIIGVLVLKEIIPQLILDSQPTPLLLRFQAGNDRRSHDQRKHTGLDKTQMESFLKSSGMTTRYFVHQREFLQPHEGDVWHCKPVELIYLDEKHNFQMIRVQPLRLESGADSDNII